MFRYDPIFFIRYTLKFDGAGNWKIIDRHRMSEKEEQQFDQRDDR